MTVVTSHERNGNFISRHFRHHDQAEQTRDVVQEGQLTFDDLWRTGNCPGESDEHRKMKSIAYARLVHDFPDADIALESGIDGRIADVLVTFPKPRAPYGKGIAVEAQYRNHGKDIAAVTDHYLQRDYSVAWVDETDISGHNIDLSEMLTVWPNALPARTGAEGYPDIIRWLWQEQSPPVIQEIPIPGEYWASFDKSDEWVTVAERQLRATGRAWTTVSRSPTGHLTFQLGKRNRRWNADTQRVTVQVEQGDCAELRSFAAAFKRQAFGQNRPTKEDRDWPWHDLTTAWLAGSPRVTTWLSASLSPENNVILTLGKKQPTETEHVSTQVDKSAVSSLFGIIDLLERAFEVEMK